MNGFFTDENGKEMLVLGMQAHNSSTGTFMMERTIRAAELFGANTLEVPVYWYKVEPQKDDSPTLTINNIGRHISRTAYLKVVSNLSPWLREAKLGGVYANPMSHGEGRFVADKEWIDRLYANGQVALQYVDPNGNPSMDEDWNPNGSVMCIEGITSPDGRVLGKMGHNERCWKNVAVNIYGEQDMKLFESGVTYFR